MTLWYTARGAGLSALLLLSISTALGALMTGRGKAADRVVWHYVHRITASLGLAVLAIHITTILADPFAHVGWRGAVIPFTAGYRPTWVGLGTIAVYTFLLVAAVGFARAKFAETKPALWRQLHSLAYLGWGMAMWHGFLSGSDSDVTWVRALYVICGAGVLTAVAVRLGRTQRPNLVRHAAPANTQTLVGAR
jgi:hypothetical protein